MDLSDIIAAFALAISLLTFASSQRAGGRAHLTASWQGPYLIRIQNHGPGLAKRVDVAPLSVDDKTVETMQVSALGALQTSSMRSVPRLGEEGPTLRISWTDNRWRRQHLTVPLSVRPTAPSLRPRNDLEAQVRAIAEDVAEDVVASHEDMEGMRRRAAGKYPK